METQNNPLSNFFAVAARGQTYLNALYLLLAFPLGLFYFIFLVTGLATGIPLIVVWVGLLILPLVFAAWYGFIAFERQMAIGMLREQIPPITYQDLSGKTLWQKFTAAFTNPVTWKGLLYLLAKFPLGTFSFIVIVTLLSVAAAFIGLPFYYQYVTSDISMTFNGVYYFNPALLVDTMPEAIIGCLIGLLILLVSLHIFNGLAWVSGKFARFMLGSFSPAPLAPVAVNAAPAAASAVDEAAPSEPPTPAE
jgi:hypothetical protein